MMGQICEEPQNEAMKIPLHAAEDHSDNAATMMSVYVYGYGPTKNPFYEEARIIRANSEGGLLIFATPVNCGQKLLLINGPGQNPVEAQVVNTRTLDAQMFEVEIAFPFPQSDFWRPLRGSAKKKGRGQTERRRFPRLTLPRGISIAWRDKEHDIARVTSLSLSGLFIEAARPAQTGTVIQVEFDIPGVTVRAKAIVRRSVPGKGMGVEFIALPPDARSALHALLQKLLGDVRLHR